MNWNHLGIFAIVIAAILTAAVGVCEKLSVLFSKICVLDNNIF